MTELERLPARIDALTLQVSQLRTEMRAEFSAVHGESIETANAFRSETAMLGEMLRSETALLGETLRGEMHRMGETLRGEMHQMGETLRGEIHQIRDDLSGEIRGLSTQMRVLHEDVIGRLALQAEGSNGRRARGRKRKQ